MSVTRYDTHAIGKVIRRPNGHLLVPATLARTGVQVYRNPDGSTRRELRLPDEVFNEDAMASLELVPVTVDHPPVMLDAVNTSKYAKGAVGENVQRDGAFVKARIAVTDAAAIAAVMSDDPAKRKSEVSVGYTCELEMTSGSYNGQPYDAIQRNIRANHVSLVSKGRGGADVRVHLDAAESIADDNTKESQVEITINGKKFDVSEDVAAAVKAERKDAEDKAAVAKTDADKLQARADAAEASLTAVKGERKDAEQIREAVKARRELERKVEKIVPAKALDKMDSQDDRALMCLAIETAQPAMKSKLEKASDAYVQAAFDVIAEAPAAPHPSLGQLRVDANDADRTDAAIAGDKAKAQFMAEQASSHTRPINLKG
jgi:hypothetical protein